MSRIKRIHLQGQGWHELDRFNVWYENYAGEPEGAIRTVLTFNSGDRDERGYLWIEGDITPSGWHQMINPYREVWMVAGGKWVKTETG